MNKYTEQENASAPTELADVVNGDGKVLGTFSIYGDAQTIANILNNETSELCQQLAEKDARIAELANACEKALEALDPSLNHSDSADTIDTRIRAAAYLREVIEPKATFNVGDKVRIRDRDDGFSSMYPDGQFDTIVLINEEDVHQLQYPDGTLSSYPWKAEHLKPYGE